MRDYQFRTIQWLQGKTWEKSTPFGPALVTTDEFAAGLDDLRGGRRNPAADAHR